jgi:hypothetical protein
MIRRWRRRPPPDPKQDLLQGVVLVVGYAQALLALARRYGPAENLDLVVAIAFLKAYEAKVREWADGGS